jgi:uncharacterized protein with PIN domain
MVRFFADEMLGRLARWLRILGYDTRYEAKISDYEFLRVASAEDRFILTRDRKLPEKSLVAKILVLKSERYAEQIKEVYDLMRLPVTYDRVFSMCLDCNLAVESLPKEKVKDRVPPYVYELHEAFHHCPRCGKVYWGGSHYANSLSKLKEILKA